MQWPPMADPELENEEVGDSPPMHEGTSQEMDSIPFPTITPGFQLEVFVKGYRGARKPITTMAVGANDAGAEQPANTQTLVTCRVADMDAFRALLWESFSGHIAGRAVCTTGESGETNWTLDPVPPTISDIQSFMELRLGTRPYRIDTTAASPQEKVNIRARIDGYIQGEKPKRPRGAQARTEMVFTQKLLEYYAFHPLENLQGDQENATNRGGKIQVHVLKYGPELSNPTDVTKVLAVISPPVETDRAGAPNEATIRDIILRLKDKHRQSLQSSEMGWRLWASSIAKLSGQVLDAAIADNPPSNMLHLFATTSHSYESAMTALRARHSLRMDMMEHEQNVLSGIKSRVEGWKRESDEALEGLKAVIEDISDRIENHFDLLSRFLENASSRLEGRLGEARDYHSSLPAAELAPGFNAALLNTVPNHVDFDHME
ncbi:hypothetical protein HDU96_001447 [Phlyctochytrium bullatum]|nr:hypothetical protein HDU96_001447 [Phlyctochytrium bullatum]